MITLEMQTNKMKCKQESLHSLRIVFGTRLDDAKFWKSKIKIEKNTHNNINWNNKRKTENNNEKNKLWINLLCLAIVIGREVEIR